MKKRVLIIDNEEIGDEISNIQRHFKNKGHEIEFVQFNIGSTWLTEVLTNDQIDLTKVEAEFMQNHKRKYDLICFDYDLDDENVTGVDVLAGLKHLLKPSTKLLFYSGRLETLVGRILSRTKRDSFDLPEAKRLLMKLIQSRVEDFVERPNMRNSVIRLLSIKEETLDDIFAEKMEHEYPNFRTEYFNGLELYELSQLLNNSDGMATKFKHEIVEQFICYLIRLHEDEE